MFSNACKYRKHSESYTHKHTHTHTHTHTQACYFACWSRYQSSLCAPPSSSLDSTSLPLSPSKSPSDVVTSSVVLPSNSMTSGSRHSMPSAGCTPAMTSGSIVTKSSAGCTLAVTPLAILSFKTLRLSGQGPVSLNRWISSSSEPSCLREIPHVRKDLTMISVLIEDQASTTHCKYTSKDGGLRFPPAVVGKSSPLSQSSWKHWIICLNGRFHDTSAGWMNFVHPPGITAVWTRRERNTPLVFTLVWQRNASQISSFGSNNWGPITSRRYASVKLSSIQVFPGHFSTSLPLNFASTSFTTRFLGISTSGRHFSPLARAVSITVTRCFSCPATLIGTSRDPIGAIDVLFGGSSHTDVSSAP